ncbi:MAG: radical SAM protein [Deltaproteobacteria bacterium]|nr:radical SAM protein [Deltaproteobacteria bacterium]
MISRHLSDFALDVKADAMSVLPSLAEFFLRSKLLRQKVALIASFKLTYRCNLTCQGCPFHLRSQQENYHMSWNTAVESIERLYHDACRILVFEGGEPLMWRDGKYTFSDLARLAHNKFLRTAVTTNGTFNLNVPTDIVWVSIDGSKSTHNRLRCNSFDKIVANLSKATHPKILVHFTINNQNWMELENLLDMLNQIPQVKGVTLQLFYPYNQGETSLALDRKTRRLAMESAIMLKRQGYPILNSTWSLKAMINNSWKCHEHLLTNVDPDGTITQGCYVKSRGEIDCSQCGFTPVAEASGAFDLIPGSLLAGWRIFLNNK